MSNEGTIGPGDVYQLGTRIARTHLKQFNLHQPNANCTELNSPMDQAGNFFKLTAMGDEQTLDIVLNKGTDGAPTQSYRVTVDRNKGARDLYAETTLATIDAHQFLTELEQSLASQIETSQ